MMDNSTGERYKEAAKAGNVRKKVVGTEAENILLLLFSKLFLSVVRQPTFSPHLSLIQSLGPRSDFRVVSAVVQSLYARLPGFPFHRRHQLDQLQQQEGETGLEHPGQLHHFLDVQPGGGACGRVRGLGGFGAARFA